MTYLLSVYKKNDEEYGEAEDRIEVIVINWKSIKNAKGHEILCDVWVSLEGAFKSRFIANLSSGALRL